MVRAASPFAGHLRDRASVQKQFAGGVLAERPIRHPGQPWGVEKLTIYDMIICRRSDRADAARQLS